MEVKFKFRDSDARTVLHFLRYHYQSKADLNTLAKWAVRDVAAQGAQKTLDAMKAADEARSGLGEKVGE